MKNKFKTTAAFPEPNFTQVPNKFFDMLADNMESSEVRVTLIMIRQTFGFHRESFKMGLSKLSDATGLSRNAVKDGAEAAEKRGTFYRTNPDEQGEAEWALVVNECLPPMQPLTPPHATIDSHSPIKESIKKDIKEKHSADKPAKPATPPEVKLFREVTSRYPNKVNFENVTNIINSVSKRLGRDCSADDLRPFYAAWCAKGFKPVNLAWLSWAETGIIPEMRQAQNKNSGADALMQYAQNIGAV